MTIVDIYNRIINKEPEGEKNQQMLETGRGKRLWIDPQIYSTSKKRKSQLKQNVGIFPLVCGFSKT